MSIVQGKLWGRTWPVYRSDFVEVWAIDVVEGGYCSEHKHDHRCNRFFLLSGEMHVWVWNGPKPDVTRLLPGDTTDVPPGSWHQFRAIKPCMGLEVYWPDFDPRHDIQRRTIGGIEQAAILTDVLGVTDFDYADGETQAEGVLD